MIALGILDQSPIPSGGTAAEAIANTLRLAQACDRLGYRRYWVAEHHNSRGLAGSAPEILIARIAAETRAIRVGSGGVMLSHYSALKVAETFRMLETLYPGRIDLGVGRAPGSDGLTARALQSAPDGAGAERFPEKLVELLSFLHENHLSTVNRVKAMPEGEGAPEIWLLGSSDWSANAAAQLGCAFSFAHFINSVSGAAITRAYRERFRPMPWLERPRASVAVFAVAADSEEDAERLAKSRELWVLRFLQGHEGPYPSVEEALAHEWSERDRAILAHSGRRTIAGTPGRVKAELVELAQEFGADEVLLVTICHDFRARLRSYELIAEAFGLEPA